MVLEILPNVHGCSPEGHDSSETSTQGQLCSHEQMKPSDRHNLQMFKHTFSLCFSLCFSLSLCELEASSPAEPRVNVPERIRKHGDVKHLAANKGSKVKDDAENKVDDAKPHGLGRIIPGLSHHYLFELSWAYQKPTNKRRGRGIVLGEECCWVSRRWWCRQLPP